MNFGVFVLGIEFGELEKCDAFERSLYNLVGIGFWIFLGLSAISGGINFYYVDDRWFTILAGAVAFPLLLGFLYRVVLLSVKRPPRFFNKKWYLRWIPDVGTFVRLIIVVVLTLLIALPLSGIMQYHRVEKIAQDKREELRQLIDNENTITSFPVSIQTDLEASEHTHYPVAVYTDLLTTSLTRLVILVVGALLFYPVGLLLFMKFSPRFQYQEGQNAKMEHDARAEYLKLEILRASQFSAYGAIEEFPHSSEFEDYPINSPRVLKIERTKNDDELLKLLWLQRK